jgi:acetyl-CoA carboxylase biotin carboxyl carrier protein
MDLTEDEVLEILKLIEQSEFDYFQLEQGELKLTVARNGYVPAGDAPATVTAPAARPAAAFPATEPVAPPPAAPGAAAAPESAADEGLVPVAAPMVGTFYAAPSPEDPPYVTVGARVEAGATLGLIEVMKVFTSIKAEASGVVEQILINNAQFVEYGQTLFRIRPD